MIANIRKKIIYIYLFVTLFLFAFVNFNGSTTFEDYLIPFINGSVIIIHFIFSFILLCGSFFLNYKMKIKIDGIFICLMIKCFLDALHFVRYPFYDYFWFYAITLISTITYFFLINVKLNELDRNKINKLFILFGTIICVQVILTFFLMDYRYLDLRYKSAMIIPYGGTNIISSILVAIIPIIFFKIKKNKYKYSLIILFVISIILTKSRGGIIITLLLLFFLAYFFSGSNKNKIIKRFLQVIFFTIILLFFCTNNNVNTLFRGFTSNTNSISIDSLFSGRFGIWNDVIKGFDNNFLFGVGMKPTETIGAGVHNIIIDLLYRCGLIGTLNYLILFTVFIKKGKKVFKISKSPYYICILCIYINSLFEVCYFSYSCDVMLWMFIGLLMNEYYVTTTKNFISKEENSYADL